MLQPDDGSRVLELNEGIVANSVWYPQTVLTGGEWDMFLVMPPLIAHPVRNVLVLGNAGPCGLLERQDGEFPPFEDLLGTQGWASEQARAPSLGERILRIFYCYHPTYGYKRSPSIAAMLA